MSIKQDITPANTFMEQFIAQTNYALIGLSVTRKTIPVRYIDTSRSAKVIRNVERAWGVRKDAKEDLDD